jgi:hypothetical protein
LLESSSIDSSRSVLRFAFVKSPDLPGTLILHAEPALYMRPEAVTKIIDEILPAPDRGQPLLNLVTKNGDHELIEYLRITVSASGTTAVYQVLRQKERHPSRARAPRAAATGIRILRIRDREGMCDDLIREQSVSSMRR